DGTNVDEATSANYCSHNACSNRPGYRIGNAGSRPDWQPEAANLQESTFEEWHDSLADGAAYRAPGGFRSPGAGGRSRRRSRQRGPGMDDGQPAAQGHQGAQRRPVFFGSGLYRWSV